MCIRIAGDVSCHDSYGFPSGQPFYPADTTLGAPTTWGAIPQTVALAAAINNESKPCVHTVAAAASVLPADVYGPGRAGCGSWCRRTRYCCNRRSLRTCPHRARSGSRLTPVTPATPPGTVHQFPTHLRVPLGTSHLYTSCAGIVSGATGVIFYAFVSPQGAQTGALLATASWTGACGTGLLGDASVC